MNTYLVTVVGARGEVTVEADGFYSRGDGDLFFYREGDPITETPDPGELPELKPVVYRPKIAILAYANGVWRTVMDKTATVTYHTAQAQGRASENTQRRQKT